MPRRAGAGEIDGVEERSQPDTRPSGAPDAPRGRFGLLLLLLVSTYLLSALTGGQWVDALQLVLFTGAALLALRNSSWPRGIVRLMVVSALGGTTLVLLLWLALTQQISEGVGDIWASLILLFAVVMIVHRVLSFSTVTLQSIYGAISAYLILGLMFAAIFGAIDHLTGTFFVHGEQASTQTFQYFSFTTLTTLGYGDFTAAGNGGRAVAVLEALAGQVFLATLVARLVAAFRTPDRQR
jgi:hypothetical protein